MATNMKKTQEMLHDRVKADIIKDLKKALPIKQGTQHPVKQNIRGKVNESQMDGI